MYGLGRVRSAPPLGPHITDKNVYAPECGNAPPLNLCALASWCSTKFLRTHDGGLEMPLPIQPPYPPMEAKLIESIPEGEGWQYEPKWDGFRCLAFRDGDKVELQSKAGQPLGRYFPEVVEAVASLPAKRFVLDGEIVVPVGEALSFDQLLQRIHPAASRVRKLSQEFPALYIVFDLLVDERGAALVEHPLSERRAALEAFAAKHLRGNDGRVHLSPATDDLSLARKWFGAAGAA